MNKEPKNINFSQRTLLLCIGVILVLTLAAFGGGFYLGQNRQKPVKTEAPAPPWMAKNPPPPPKEETIPEQRLTFYDNLTGKGGKASKTAKTETPSGKEKDSSATKESKSERTTASAKEKPEVKSKPSETAGAKNETASAPGKGNYMIHLASLKSQQGAEILAARLQKKGYNVKINVVDLGEKGTWHRILLGGYSSKEEAERVAENLRKKEGLSPVVRAGRE